MAYFTETQATGSQDDSSPFLSLSLTGQTSQTDTPDQMQSQISLDQNMLSRDIRGMPAISQITPYTLRLQSNRFFDDLTPLTRAEIQNLLNRDLSNRVTEVSKSIAEFMFPDTAFGFPINYTFVKNFHSSFLSNAGEFDPLNFRCDEESIAVFLNRMISTMASFLDSTKQVSLKPLRYFTAAHSKTPLEGHPTKRKPDIILIPLINDCLRTSTVGWSDVQALVEHTRELSPPQRLPDTVSVKSYMAFCTQPERDFFITLCITGAGFHIVISDHVGQIETDVLPFSESLVFIRMILGLAFLPDSFVGIDTTITRNMPSKDASSKQKFTSLFSPFPYNSNSLDQPSITLIAPSSGSSVDSPSSGSTVNGPSTVTSIFTATSESSGTPRSPGGIRTISIGSNTYDVVKILFKSQTMIGRATIVWLVKLEGSKEYAVLKDSWITMDRLKEAEFLEELDIPFGAKLVDHHVLRNTHQFRESASKMARVLENREKRRVLTSPAGVHISDFSSLWELLLAFLDVVIAILHLETHKKVHRDISYTNILLRERDSSDVGVAARENVMRELGLLEIEDLRKQLNCREGLLIDFDYGASLIEEQVVMNSGEMQTEAALDKEKGVSHNFKPASGSRTGTPPFIAIELLLFGIPHRVSHDLESLFYVLLFICTHLDGPHNTIGDPPLYGVGSEAHPSVIKQWLCATNLVNLGHLKNSHMNDFFESLVLPAISPYFNPLKGHLVSLWDKIRPERFGRQTGTSLLDPVHSDVTCLEIIETFKTILLDKALISQANHTPPTVLGKRSERSFPGDLAVAANGWDVVNPGNVKLAKVPKTNPNFVRKRRLMTKGKKGDDKKGDET